MTGRHLAMAALFCGLAASTQARAGAWPQCTGLTPGASIKETVAVLGSRGRKTAFAVVDNLPVATYAFRRATLTCRVQFEEGMVLARPILR